MLNWYYCYQCLAVLKYLPNCYLEVCPPVKCTWKNESIWLPVSVLEHVWLCWAHNKGYIYYFSSKLYYCNSSWNLKATCVEAFLSITIGSTFSAGHLLHSSILISHFHSTFETIIKLLSWKVRLDNSSYNLWVRIIFQKYVRCRVPTRLFLKKEPNLLLKQTFVVLNVHQEHIYVSKCYIYICQRACLCRQAVKPTQKQKVLHTKSSSL